MSASINQPLLTTAILDAPVHPVNPVVDFVPKPLARPSEPNSGVWTYLFPVLAGLAIRILVGQVWLGQTGLNNDAADYFSEATKLSNGTREAVAFYWPPGTSFYLYGWFVVFGSSVTVARIAMILLSTLQIAVVGGLAREATGRRDIAAWASWIWAVYPPSVLLIAQTYSQHLAGLSLALIAWCGIRSLKTQSVPWLIAFGLSLGIGCLTRPSMMSVLAVSCLAVGITALCRAGSWQQRLTRAIGQGFVVIVPAALVIAPVILYNARCGGGYSLSTNNERNFFLGNNPYTPWYKTSHFAQRPLSELPPEVQTYLKSLYEAPNRRAAMKQAAINHIIENPGLAALRTANRARSFWGFDYLATRAIQATTEDLPRYVSAAVLLAEAGGYYLVMVLGLIGLIQCWNWRTNLPVIGWYVAVIGAYAAPYCLAFSSGTYHFPVMGVMAPLAAIGIFALGAEGWRATVGSARTSVPIVLFTLMQVEYGYFTLAAGVSENRPVAAGSTDNATRD
jgi:hypothetical protein